MFIFKFKDSHKDRLITRVKIDGPFITFYCAPQNAERFKECVSKIDDKYGFLSIGEGIMHDYAHGKDNKHILSLFSGAKTIHFHIMCQSMAKKENLVELLSYFPEADLSTKEKKQIIEEYEQYLNQPNLSRLIMNLKGIVRTIAAVMKNDPYIRDKMPKICEVFRDLPDDIDPQDVEDYMIAEFDNYNLSLKKILIGMEKMSDMTEVIGEIAYLLEKSAPNLDKNKLINHLQEQFTAASKIEIVNYKDIFPFAKQEFADHFPETDVGILLSNTAKDLSALLGIEIKYEPKYVDRPKDYSAEVPSENEQNEQIEYCSM